MRVQSQSAVTFSQSPSLNLSLSLSLPRSLIAPSAFCGSVRKCRHSNGICFGLVPCAKHRALMNFLLARTATTALGLSILWVCVCVRTPCAKKQKQNNKDRLEAHTLGISVMRGLCYIIRIW